MTALAVPSMLKSTPITRIMHSIIVIFFLIVQLYYMLSYII